MDFVLTRTIFHFSDLQRVFNRELFIVFMYFKIAQAMDDWWYAMGTIDLIPFVTCLRGFFSLIQ